MDNGIIKKSIRKVNIFYYIAIFLGIISIMLDTSRIVDISDIIITLLKFSCIALLLIKIFLDNIKKPKTLLVIIIFAIPILFITIRVEWQILLLNYLAIVALKGVDIKKVIKIDLFIKFIFLLSHFAIYFLTLYFSGGSESVITYFSNSGTVRHTLFLNNPNTFGILFFWMIIDWLYLAKGNVKTLNKRVLISLVLMIIGFLLHGSRTTMYLYAVFIVFYCISKIHSKNINYTKITKFIAKYSIDILLLFTIVAVIYYGKVDILNIFNQFFSNRFKFANRATQIYGIHLFPNPGSIGYEKVSIVDNFYAKSMISTGIFSIFLISYLIKKAVKNTDNLTNILIIMFTSYLFFEISPFSVGISLAILIIGKYALYGDEMQEEVKTINE